MLIVVASLTCYAAADYPAKDNVETVIDGVTCMVDYHSDGTANLWKVIIPDTCESSSWAVPDSVTYKDGQIHTVTRLNLSTSSDEGDFTSLTLPDTLTDLATPGSACLPN